MNSKRNYWLPGDNAVQISKMLHEGRRLIVCLCASWCSSCQTWENHFSQLAQEYTADCFVWLDIDKHPDMVADVDLDTLPVILIQDNKTVYFLGTIKPEISILKKLLGTDNLKIKVQDPGIRSFLLEDGEAEYNTGEIYY
ncbi:MULTISPECIES: thioredoxin domain-containing protein [Escherichia]|uniref:thioredoxin domain-containing protein n=1 Tax=Escherichia TaxID=561 RepID=UPI00098CD03B|nr:MULTISPECIES: thioredoxin family protein [Escherichia]MEC9496701.1 thioredoxin family protein [Escherichia whittamii]MEC9561748.1 thioredoxin family protein [Escherichia whittamii]QLX43397.1 thioredoxin family protein [Escherichia coli]